MLEQINLFKSLDIEDIFKDSRTWSLENEFVLQSMRSGYQYEDRWIKDLPCLVAKSRGTLVVFLIGGQIVIQPHT